MDSFLPQWSEHITRPVYDLSVSIQTLALSPLVSSGLRPVARVRLASITATFSH